MTLDNNTTELKEIIQNYNTTRQHFIESIKNMDIDIIDDDVFKSIINDFYQMIIGYHAMYHIGMKYNH